MKENKKRSIAKGISYRIFGTVVTVVISYRVTGSIKNSIGIGGLDVVSKILLYYVHERMWQRTNWGKRHHN